MTRRLVAAMASLCLAGASMAASTTCHLSQVEMPVRIVNHRPVAFLKLNGTEVPMLVDSGAFFSMLQPATAAELKLPLGELPRNLSVHGYAGRIESKLTRVEQVTLGATTLRDVEFIVGGNELGSGIRGVLGRNFLSMADTEYDLAHGMVRLVFPEGACDKTPLAYWAGDAPLIEAPLLSRKRDDSNAIRVPVSVNGQRLTAVMDTGAVSTRLTLRAARRGGVKEDELVPSGRIGGAGQGRVNSWTSRIATFDFGGERVSNNEFSIDDNDYFDDDMLIGLDYFLAHRIYVSRLQRKVFATWNGGPIFARGAAAGPSADRDAARPAALAGDDPQALARRGEARAARGDTAGALADLTRSIELAPELEANWVARARVHWQRQDADQALRDLDEALRLQPALNDARVLRVSLRVQRGQAALALSDLAVLDQALPPTSDLRQRMAQAYADLSMAPEALQQWRLWEDTHANDAALGRMLNSRCWLRTRLKLELSLAVEDCKAAVRADPKEPAALDSLGWAFLQSGDASLAIAAFDAALEIKPIAYSHYGRGLAWHRLGARQAGQRDLAKARQLQPLVDSQVRRDGLPLADDAPAP
jgi:predicted aspartyl protease/lipoprotein NlpI